MLKWVKYFLIIFIPPLMLTSIAALVRTADKVGQIYHGGPPTTAQFVYFVVTGGFYAAILALFATCASVIYTAVAALIGRRSRHALHLAFAVGYRFVPVCMTLSALGLGLGACALMICILPVLGGIGELRLGLIIIALGLSTCVVAFSGLRNGMRMFTMISQPQLGRAVIEKEAPGLWHAVRVLAKRIGAEPPDNIIVGFLGGPFVTAAPMVTMPQGRGLTGRTLYVPIPTLLILELPQISSILLHELAHFSGKDTEFSLKVVPALKGVERSVAQYAAAGARGRVLSSPIQLQGLWFITLLGLTAKYWSRLREFEADAASAKIVGATVAASALVKFQAYEPLIRNYILRRLPNSVDVPDDLIAELRQTLAEVAAPDMRPVFGTHMPHPTDTHPTTLDRVKAMGSDADQSVAAIASALSAQNESVLTKLFVDPAILSRVLTGDLVRTFRSAQEQQALRLSKAVSSGAQAPRSR